MPDPLRPRTLAPFGEDALLATFDPGPDDIALAARLHAVADALAAQGLWREITPAETSVAARFDPVELHVDAARRAFMEAMDMAGNQTAAPGPGVEIPVCYDPALAPDLEFVCQRSGLSPAAIALAHAKSVYTVTMVGFTPGFAYLGPLDARLSVPRLEQPRTRVEAGSVGIAGDRTAVYPMAGPGGWRIIGQSPARLFRPDTDDPFTLKAGMRVRFVPIGRAAFDATLSERAR